MIRAAIKASPGVSRLGWRSSPLDVLAAWPADRPVIALLTSPGHPRWGRWSILASPTDRITSRADPQGRPRTVASGSSAELTHDPLADLQSALDRTAVQGPFAHQLPFVGGWIGWLSYDLGRVVESSSIAKPADGPPAAADRSWPLLEMFHCPGALIHDAADGSWHAVGEPANPFQGDPPAAAPERFRATGVSSTSGAQRYRRDVERIRGLIARGDLFQANLAHRLTGRFKGSPRALAGAMLGGAHPWFGALIESCDASGALEHAIVSASPELFLSVDEHRRVVSRPIKGTCPASADSRVLRASEKDRAELTMITDLMRNDLGRVCSYASVSVDDPRALEHHGAPPGSTGVYHTVATVSGTLRLGATHTDLLRATFPPGSVTGAPKVRAMQVIDALEPVRRGPYCGAVGYISDHGPACWNVAIRTAVLTCDRGSTPSHAAGTLDFSVGAGIVHESNPDSEWQETLAKAGVLRAALATGAARKSPIEAGA